MTCHQIITIGHARDHLTNIKHHLLDSVSFKSYDDPPLSLTIPELTGLVIVFQSGPLQKAVDAVGIVRNHSPQMPIIFVAKSNTSRENIIEIFRHGVQDCLLCPYTPDKLAATIKKYLCRKDVVIPMSTPATKMVRLGQQPFSGNPTVKPMPIPNPTPLSLDHHSSGKKCDLNVRFFGKFMIYLQGKLMQLLPGEKANALLAYLLYANKSPIHREKLISKFWGYNSPHSARNSLNVAMHHIRKHQQKVFPDIKLIHYEHDKYALNPDLTIETDTCQFLAAWKKGRSIELEQGLEHAVPNYQQAVSYYQDDFLNDIHYEEWCNVERNNLKETYLLLLNRLGTHHLQAAEYDVALETYKKMLAKDPCLEDVHRKMILCYYKLGYRDVAIKQYYKCSNILKEELKIEPSGITKQLLHMVSEERTIPLEVSRKLIA